MLQLWSDWAYSHMWHLSVASQHQLMGLLHWHVIRVRAVLTCMLGSETIKWVALQGKLLLPFVPSAVTAQATVFFLPL